MKKLLFALLLVMTPPPSAWAGGLELSIRGGLVTLDAQDVTVRQILIEWARIGKTQIVNAERITGGPVTLKLEGIPERQALETVLRSVPGYIALPRQAQIADASTYDRILIMPTTTAVAAVKPPTPGPGASAGFPGMGGMTQLRPQQPPPPPMLPGVLPDPSDADDDDPAIAAAAAAGLIPVPASTPGPSPISAPLTMPGFAQQPSQSAPSSTAPSNPWNAPAGTSQPSLAPPAPPPPAPTAPITRTRPPQPDR
jgi:hypothetical protein